MMTSLATKIVARPCPLCGSATGAILHTQTFVLPAGCPLAAEYDVVSCLPCGFVYADMATPQTQFDQFYAQLSKYADRQTPMGGGSLSDINRAQRTATYLAQQLPDRQAHIADIGCANGTLLGVLQKLGYNRLSGVDPSPACVENIQRQYDGIDVYANNHLNLPVGLNNLDLVIMSHVLEHVRDVRPALEQIHARLGSSGCLYLEVPDAARYADFVFSPWQEFNLEHIAHFSSLSLASLLQSCGFRVRESQQTLIESPLGIPYPVIMTIAEKVSPPPAGQALSPCDLSLKRHIQTYIEVSQQMLTKIDLKLRQILSEQNRIIVWGTGQLTLTLLAETVLTKAAISAFVDSNPFLQGQKLMGVPIQAPTQIVGRPEPIIVASTLYYDEICKYISEVMKLPNAIFSLL
jgi:SAM-dependent methyltransferase